RLPPRRNRQPAIAKRRRRERNRISRLARHHPRHFFLRRSLALRNRVDQTRARNHRRPSESRRETARYEQHYAQQQNQGLQHQNLGVYSQIPFRISAAKRVSKASPQRIEANLSPAPSHLRGYLFAAAAAVLWGFSGAVTKYLLRRQMRPDE